MVLLGLPGPSACGPDAVHLAKLSNSARQTQEQGIVKTDVTPSVSCLTTN